MLLENFFILINLFSNKKHLRTVLGVKFGGRGWIRTTEGAADRFTVCSLWPLGNPSIFDFFNGADDWNRTRNLLITNQLLCQLSYISVKTWCLGAESNHRHRDFQSLALPTELPRHTSCFLKMLANITSIFKLATRKGLEPSTSSVTGWRTNHLYYRANLYFVLSGGPSRTRTADQSVMSRPL